MAKRAAGVSRLAALALLAGALSGVSARANLVTYISPTPPGSEMALLTILNANAGTGSTYHQVGSGSSATIDNQVLLDTFTGSGTVTFTRLAQHAGHAAVHQFGFYTSITNNPIGPGPSYPTANSTFVIGGSGSGLPSTATPTITGAFGLLFYDPENTPGASPNNFFPSESVWDPLGRDTDHHIAIFQDYTAMGVLIPNSYLVAIEDLHSSPDLDYNDFVARVVVPEPGTVGLLGLALVAALLRRRRQG
jgi:hypothetical protein